jgi:hypothetical protein
VIAVRRHGLALGVASAGLATAIASFAHAPVQLRAPLVVAFAVVGPGAGLVPLLGLRDPLGELTLAIGASLALDVAVALALVYSGAWAPQAGMAILVAMTLAGAAAQVLQTSRRAS